MLLDQRRDQILNFLRERGYASLQDLVTHVDVSESTIRRDLEYFEGLGEIRRTRGGAAYTGSSLVTFDDRSTRALSEKQKIAREIAGSLQPGESVLLDGGTTTLELARHLMQHELQVVTNSLPIVNALVNAPRIELVFLGGYLYPKTGVALGPMTAATLKMLRVRKLVLSAGGITEEGLFNSNSLLVEAERMMLDTAEEVIVAADSGKFGHVELVRLCGLEQVDRLVVDDSLDPTWRQKLKTANVNLIVAE